MLGFTYISRRGNYHLLLNGNVSYRTQVKTFINEIQPILNDMPQHNYIIGLNLEHLELEVKADVVSIQLFGYLLKS